MKEFIVDIHCHPSLRAFYAPKGKPGMEHWNPAFNEVEDNSFNRFIRMQSKDMYKGNQCSFNQLLDSNVNIVIDALYPVERGWISLRRVPGFMVGKDKQQAVMINATGFDDGCIDKIANTSYMDTLQEMYDLLLRNEGKQKGSKKNYQLVEDFKNVQANLKEDENRLNVILAIEGSHVFGTDIPGFESLGFQNQCDLVEEQVRMVKAWKSVPFYVTMAHHFWNGFVGQARSLKKPFSLLYNQNRGIDKGISRIGWFLIHELLTPENGKRILIDIKHMSVEARQEYYDFVRSNNYLNPKNKIPIICSHTGISGYKRLYKSIEKPDDQAKFKTSAFNNWSINICDDDVIAIHESEGLIGIMLDKSLLVSPPQLDKMQFIKDPMRRKNAFLKAIWDNVFGMVEAIQEPTAWDIIALGTDFEGQISFMEFYPTSNYLPELREDLATYLVDTKYKQECWFDMTPKKLVRKIFQTNAMDFIKKHF